MDQIYLQTKAVVEELGEKAGLKAGQILVVGCSTSEVLGAKIALYLNALCSIYIPYEFSAYWSIAAINHRYRYILQFIWHI